ncbi:sister chromatid cohesion C-terminus-domain-containing protein [Fusarium solani]|uniref:Sister chromatid cohesion protein n=1 Tax=Fusarium solani TaxID=169388 RepID=A0A9P9RDD5_FUSSL|nr:sister chromatid cohesion C-terminus-domain-containing protein [Fusarium solani]KAH7275451.1 sister chromatid cohesion C-terminus-domain-containing protein [Fusarium solani]
MNNMQPNSHGGPQNGLFAHQGTTNPNPSISRPFTLQESLPYSPQTSTIPFISDIIPDPTLGSGSVSLPLSDLFQTQEFNTLNREIAGQPHMPRHVKQVVDHVLQDIKPGQRTRYKFCAVSRTSSAPPTGKGLIDDLSPISKTIVEKVGIGSYYKASKSTVPESKQPNGHPKGHPTPKLPHTSLNAPTTPQSSHPAQNSQAHRSNSVRIEVAIPSKRQFDPSAYVDVSNLTQQEVPAPVQSQHLHQAQQYPQQMQMQPQLSAKPLQPTPEAGQNPAFRIELPVANINRDEYLEMEERPDDPHHLSVRKGNQQEYSNSQDLIGESLDQRQRSEAALDTLDKLVRSVFTSVHRVLSMEPGYDHIVSVSQDQEVAMTASTQQKMHGAIQKTISLRCFDRVPVEHLMQIMKLSEASLKQVEDWEMRVDDSWSEEEVNTWVQQLADVETMLKSARTCLRILSGGRDDKQLYSETVIQRSVDIFRKVTEDIVMLLVELRPSGSAATAFKAFSKNKKPIATIFLGCQKLFALLAELVTKIELSDTVINSLEFTASRLIFMDNAYFEKDSVVGVQKFDGLRSVAMDMLCQIFLIKPQQRQGIIDEILTSLEKLPVGKQSARQFKLSDGGSIQPVSALIMRLVQASSGRVNNSNERNRNKLMRNINGEEEEDDDDENLPPESKRFVSSIKSEEQGARQHAVSIKDLETSVAPLLDTAQRNASYVINFMVSRAISSTKSGDSPYRNLLDLFVEDFTTCLDLPDWPSAELLLRLLVFMMVQQFEGPKTAAPAKNMALELLGGCSAAISRLRSHVKRLVSSSEGNDADDLSRYLADLATQAREQRARVEQIVAWAGPYRATLESLQGRCHDDPHLLSAISFLVTGWASQVHNGYDSYQESDDERDEELGRLGFRLRMMIEDRRWLVNEYTFKSVSANQAKLAYSIILLRSPFCEAYDKILNILLRSMGTDQATVRSKSLKSVNQVLETDPSILDVNSNVLNKILECAGDTSTQVRDSALGLLGNCMTMRPALEDALTEVVVNRFQDSGVGVRKRAMKLARDIYLRNHSRALRSLIANGLLRRVHDPDESVCDLARQVIEEVWFAPFYRDDGTAVYQTSLTEHVSLVIQTVNSGMLSETLDKVFRSILRPKDKSLQGPFSVCSKLVANMFGLIDNLDSDDSTVPSGRDALNVLTIFANADPKLFNFEQIRLLKPHLASFAKPEELTAFRSVTVIYRRVLPTLSTVHSDFLLEVRKLLLGAVGKLNLRAPLDDLIACTLVVCELLNVFEPLANAMASSLAGLQRLRSMGKLDEKTSLYLNAYCLVIGMIAKHCDLDNCPGPFKKKFPKWPGGSVARLAIDTLAPFTAPSQPLDSRRPALDAIGLACQSWPRNYVIPKVYTAFQQVFDEQVPSLENAILRSFREFLIIEEKRSETAGQAPSGKKKELTVMGGTSYDDVASATTQRFLKDITRIALSSQDEHAFLAMEVLGSINRQGLTHPKETGVTLITLETSSNRKIAELAWEEHRSLHEKHETVLEREYVKAVQSAFAYQRDVVGEPHGATTNPFQSKLHYLMETLKISKMKNRQRFLDKLCGQVDFELAKLDMSGDIPTQMVYARFIIENLAYFEYQTMGELQTTVSAMEKILTSTGAPVAQAIESEVFNVRMDVDQPPAAPDGPLGFSTADSISVSAPVDGQPSVAPAPAFALTVEPARLRQLTTAAIILLSMWEVRTFIRRLFGMGLKRQDTKVKALAKDLNKSPVKVQGVHGDKVWDEIESLMKGLQDQEHMIKTCSAFVELLNVDKDLKVVEDAGEMDLEPATPSADEDEEGDVMADRGRKRKGGSTPGGRKKRARSSSQPRKRGRPRKNRESVEHDVEADLDGDWF